MIQMVRFKEPLEFEWDEANISHIARHKVSPEEAEKVFFDKDNIVKKDIEHSGIE